MRQAAIDHTRYVAHHGLDPLLALVQPLAICRYPVMSLPHGLLGGTDRGDVDQAADRTASLALGKLDPREKIEHVQRTAIRRKQAHLMLRSGLAASHPQQGVVLIRRVQPGKLGQLRQPLALEWAGTTK